MSDYPRQDPRYHQGIDLFNRTKFFEAHEVWEELWHETRGEPKDFVQGLIQWASSLHHFGNGNMKGTRMLFDSGVELLSPYGDGYEGIDLKELKQQMTRCLGPVLEHPLEKLAGRAGGEGLLRFKLDETKLPKIGVTS